MAGMKFQAPDVCTHFTFTRHNKEKRINSSLFYVSLAIHAHWTVCVCVSGAWFLRDNSNGMTHCQNGLAD